MATQTLCSTFNEDKVRIFRLIHMTYFEARDVLYQIYQWGTQDKDPSIQLDTFLIDELGYAKTRIRNNFTREQRDMIAKDLSGSSYDVTMLGLAINMACMGLRRPIPGVLWVPEEFEDPLRILIVKIRDFRNSCAHKQPFSIEEQMFHDLTEELRILLKETLEVGAKFFGIDVDECNKLVKATNEKLDKSRYDCIENQDIMMYKNHILLIEKRRILLGKGKEQLVERYMVFSHVSPASFFTGTNIHLRVGLVFTHMEIVESGSSCPSENTIDYQDILEFTQNATITNGSKTDVLLIEGIAGAGKSTLTKVMVSQWRDNSSPMQHLLDYDLLIYYECRNSAVQSFTQLLETLMPQLILSFKEGDLMKCVLSLKLLIIVDGLDELNKSSTKVIKEVLDIGNLTVVTIICTSRPEYVCKFYALVPAGQHVTHIKIKGIPKEKRTEFVVKYHEELKRLGISQQETDGLIEYLNKSSKHLEEPLRLPLNLVWLTIMYSLTPDHMNNVTGATDLYTEILSLNKMRLMKKLATTEGTSHLDIQELTTKLDRFILHLSWEALISLKEETFDALSDESIERLRDACSSLGLPHEPVLSAFLVERITFTTTRTKSTFSFVHKGEQDYLAANYQIQALSGNDLRFDITSITKIIQSHPSFKNESLRHDFIHHIMNFLDSSLPSETAQKDSATNFLKPESLIPCGGNPRPYTIYSVLEGLYGINKVPSDLSRYQNMLAYTAGLLYRVPEMIRQEVADEIVRIFQQTNVLDKDQWLDFITEMKCDERLAKSIVSQVPNLARGNTNISSSRVGVYSKLLPHGTPNRVTLNLADNVEEIPDLETLMTKLADKENCFVDIYLHYHFRNSMATSASLDVNIRRVFERCRIRKFMGRLSEECASLLPSTLQSLWTQIDERNAEATSGALSGLAEKAPTLSALYVHVVPNADPAVLSPLPGKVNLDLLLFISDVDVTSIGWACRVAKNLQPTEGKMAFSNILFPRCHLTTDEFMDLLGEMKSHEIRVCKGILNDVVVASSRIPEQDLMMRNRTREAEDCPFRWSEEDAMWPKIMEPRKSSRAQSKEDN